MGLTFTGDSVEATKIIEQRQAAEHVASLKSLLFILASKSDVDVRFSTALGAARAAPRCDRAGGCAAVRGYRTLGAAGRAEDFASLQRCRQENRVEVGGFRYSDCC
jgi:hypothetical protein